MFNWLTPGVQKGIATAFVFSWFLAQGRFKWFWLALSGQATLGTSSGSVGIIGTAVLPDLVGGQQDVGGDTGGGGTSGEEPPTEPPPDELPPTGGGFPELTPGEDPTLLPEGL